jgi:hypothetical protein
MVDFNVICLFQLYFISSFHEYLVAFKESLQERKSNVPDNYTKSLLKIWPALQHNVRKIKQVLTLNYCNKMNRFAILYAHMNGNKITQDV